MVWGGYVWKDSFRTPLISAIMATIWVGRVPGSGAGAAAAAGAGVEVGAGAEVGGVGAAFSLLVSWDESAELVPSFGADDCGGSRASEEGRGARKRGSWGEGATGEAGSGIRGTGKSFFAIWGEAGQRRSVSLMG